MGAMAASPKPPRPIDVGALKQRLEYSTPEPENVVAARIALEKAAAEHQQSTESRAARQREKWDYFVMIVFAVSTLFCSLVIYRTHPPDDSSRSARAILGAIISAAVAYSAGRTSK
jgi:hypothetical protein